MISYMITEWNVVIYAFEDMILLFFNTYIHSTYLWLFFLSSSLPKSWRTKTKKSRKLQFCDISFWKEKWSLWCSRGVQFPATFKHNNPLKMLFCSSSKTQNNKQQNFSCAVWSMPTPSAGQCCDLMSYEYPKVLTAQSSGHLQTAQIQQKAYPENTQPFIRPDCRIVSCWRVHLPHLQSMIVTYHLFWTLYFSQPISEHMIYLPEMRTWSTNTVVVISLGCVAPTSQKVSVSSH